MKKNENLPDKSGFRKLNKLILTIFVSLSVLSCGFIKEKLGQKVEEKVNKELEKSKQQVENEMKKADSIRESASKEMNRDTKVNEALDEEKILNDDYGQWASEADASSSFAADKTGKDAGWSPQQMIGKPDVESYGDQVHAWASKDPNTGIEWVRLTYPKSVNATKVRVRQTFNPGAIIRIELIDIDGKSHMVWEGIDKTKYESGKMKYFTAEFDETPYKTKVVKITLATNSVPGWNEIDAVQLVGE